MRVRSFAVEMALRKLGRDINDARRRRRISTALMAERIGATRVTLRKIEKGDPSVSMGSYALAVHMLDKLDELSRILDRTEDEIGLDLMDERLPKRIRGPKAPPDSA